MRAPALLLVVLVAGCGGDPDPLPPVTGVVDLDPSRSSTTSAAAFSFTGRVRPADARLTVSDGSVRVEPSGRFTVAVASPESGTKGVRIEATSRGRRPWRTDVRVVRGSPERVRVPERDTLAPTTALLFEPDGADPVVLASPSRAGEKPDVVALPGPTFRATGVVRDPGGTGRVRLSMITTTRCGSSEKRRVRLLPPAQIVSIAIPPGAMAPLERARTARYRLPVRRGCTIRGELYAEGTDAHGRQAVTHHAAFRHP